MLRQRKAEPPAWVVAVRGQLEAYAEPEAAAAMQVYMKSELPFRGVNAPLRRKLTAGILRAAEVENAEALAVGVRALWYGRTGAGPRVYREERYVAIEWLTNKRFAPLRSADTLSLYEELITDGAWWDYVDHLAKHGVGELLKRFPREIKPQMLSWATDPNLWKRRSAILCQLDFKAGTDLKLLAAVIQPNLSEPDFFIRKAIGWALRQYGWTDPAWVEAYVAEHPLSPLSQKEALKSLASAKSKLDQPSGRRS